MPLRPLEYAKGMGDGSRQWRRIVRVFMRFARAYVVCVVSPPPARVRGPLRGGPPTPPARQGGLHPFTLRPRGGGVGVITKLFLYG